MGIASIGPGWTLSSGDEVAGTVCLGRDGLGEGFDYGGSLALPSKGQGATEELEAGAYVQREGGGAEIKWGQ